MKISEQEIHNRLAGNWMRDCRIAFATPGVVLEIRHNNNPRRLSFRWVGLSDCQDVTFDELQAAGPLSPRARVAAEVFDLLPPALRGDSKERRT